MDGLEFGPSACPLPEGYVFQLRYFKMWGTRLLFTLPLAARQVATRPHELPFVLSHLPADQTIVFVDMLLAAS